MSDLVRWARALQAIAQSGLTYSENPYERERFEAVQGIAAEIAALAGGEEPAALHALFAAEYGFGTPKVDVRGVVVRQDELLLVREVGDERWTLPGGWADVGHSPATAVEKEVREEAGLSVTADRLLAVYDRDFRGRPRWPAHVYKVYVACSAADDARPEGDGLETAEATFFSCRALPALSPKTPGAHLERVLRIAAGELTPEVD